MGPWACGGRPRRETPGPRCASVPAVAAPDSVSGGHPAFYSSARASGVSRHTIVGRACPAGRPDPPTPNYGAIVDRRVAERGRRATAASQAEIVGARTRLGASEASGNE